MGRLDFLKQYQSRNTVISYKSALKGFFETIYNQREPLEDLAEKYFSEKRDVEKDIQNFLVGIKGFAPKTMKLRLSALRVFLLENNVELPQRFWRRLRGRVKGSRALTRDKVPSNTDLRKILMHLPIQGKALYLTLATSGMRINEALQLKLEDVNLDVDPVKINIRGEYAKTGNSRFTFISSEAREIILEWLKVRSEYLTAASKKSRHKKSVEDRRLFPFSPTNARVIWNIGLAKSGNNVKDETTQIHRIHPHVLRKFFRSQLGTVIPVDVVETLMGHENYLTETYRKYADPEKTLADFYKRGEHVLLIFTEMEEVGKLRQEVEERNRQLQSEVEGFRTEYLKMDARISRTETEVIRMSRAVEEALSKLVEIEKKVRELEKG